ncbi:M23 family metallopeptidase [Campylobacter sp. VicNov18]|uniref:M23 family metallopeptidase n=1 Tax=Campylobacter bilis TaxID=2691918 RepID=UPI00130D9411|nr:M23 family metallopeptidase [Campylobacter bilis]MPV63016.1 peptidoglycan DD-metalloendopeptidase family protein [Campylobacter hepaticus]MBM0636515.1 peptidoglycan DD-metalloendopeptidase family protein [Campylobacter bilis]MCC8277225.1 M23 family metallopeptidase [Campylobacter bilis]MCC8298968.1 M23 family metallopeptidase [Campylobacter bilis]MCC8300134.1 M23 family metallopeptidase [Campylobacter bilis]
MIRKKGKIYLFILFVFLIIILIFSILKLSIFEKNPPQILMPDIIYTNLKKPILVHVKDDESAIKNVQIILHKDNNNTMVIADEKISDLKDLTLQIALPKFGYKENVKSFVLEVVAKDNSLWNFFNGNEARKQITVLIDTTAPKINIISNSYQIEQGGAAAVVFEAKDSNLDKVYIQTNKGKIFKATPYIKEGYYAALIAWDARDEEFRAFVIASDKAGNISKERIRYYFSNRKYRVSNINLTDKFLDGKIEDLANQYAPKDNNFNRYEKFKFVNETLRNSNEKLIHEITSKVPEERFGHFNLDLFLPLKNGMKVADFADHRYYSYKGQFISDSYHMGLDLASVAQAPIISNNAGELVFAQENGIYGLNLIIYHGFGVYSLYGHCSSKNVDQGEQISKQSVIANTGTSGLALGDHLHFGILVQGVETRPEQWQDKKWLENNIYNVLNDARKIILGKN